MVKFQNLKASGWLGLLFALSVSSFFLYKSFGLGFLSGLSSYWQSDVDDIAQYISGFNMYFAAPWRFPLLAFDGVNYPEGTRVTFVDAIPLYSFILKLFIPSSFFPFNPFGAWIALCFLLQSVGAWWIARELRVESWFFLIALVGFFIIFPALMVRIGHISLMSHWILLFAIALHIRSFRLSSISSRGWVALLVSSFYINIYIFTMASGFFVASLFSLSRKIAKRDVFNFLLPFFVLALTSLVLLLPLPIASVSKEGGFGYYSMNLLSPLMGGSVFSLQASDVLGQYEGFNYLGLGVLFGLLAVLLFCRKACCKLFGRHNGLLLLLFLFTLYSISNQIYFGQVKLLDLRYPQFMDAFTSQFRASGRFFWPVGYCLIVFAVLCLHRTVSQRVFSISVVILLTLQVVDLDHRYEILRNTVNRTPKQVLNYEAWKEGLGSQIHNLYFYPKFRCGSNPHETLLPVMLYSAKNQLKLNTGYIARHAPLCNDIQREIEESDFDRSAYIFAAPEYTDKRSVVKLLPESNRFECAEIQFAVVCKKLNTEKKHD